MQAESFGRTVLTFPYRCPRRHERVLFSVPITLHQSLPSGVRTAHGITLDISEGGLGALVQGDLCVGDAVEIDLPLPERILRPTAVVRHTSSTRSGFEFLGLSPEEQRQIRTATAAPRRGSS